MPRPEPVERQLTLPLAPDSTHVGDLLFVRHPKARRYVIRVIEDGTVRVTLPRWGSKREAARFVARERQWIEKEQRRVQALSPSPPAQAREIDRDTLDRAKHELPIRLRELAAQHGLVVSRISVRNQQWRWGSCSPSGHICLN